MNKGLQKNTIFLEKTIGNSGTVLVNLNKDDAGMFINIPIFASDDFIPIVFFNTLKEKEKIKTYIRIYLPVTEKYGE